MCCVSQFNVLFVSATIDFIASFRHVMGVAL